MSQAPSADAGRLALLKGERRDLGDTSALSYWVLPRTSAAGRLRRIFGAIAQRCGLDAYSDLPYRIGSGVAF